MFFSLIYLVIMHIVDLIGGCGLQRDIINSILYYHYCNKLLDYHMNTTLNNNTLKHL